MRPHSLDPSLPPQGLRLTDEEVGTLGREITGDIPKIIANETRLYEGDLVLYFRTIFFNATNLENSYHNFRHMLHVTWLCHQACEYYRAELTPLQMRELLSQRCSTTLIIPVTRIRVSRTQTGSTSKSPSEDCKST